MYMAFRPPSWRLARPWPAPRSRRSCSPRATSDLAPVQRRYLLAIVKDRRVRIGCSPWIRTPMARITVEDCLHNVDNLFQLVLLAAQRARRIANGAEPTVPWENDKPTVVALREIAAGNITIDMLREPEPPAEPVVPELEPQSSFRAPQFGLGD